MDNPRTVLVFDGQNSLVSISKPLPPMPVGITIEFWALGADDLPQNTSLFSASLADGTRVLNIHLPWSNGSVYWDAGLEGGEYDRVIKSAEPTEYKGSWNHWAFVKDVARGEMAIYRDGILWHREAGKPKTIPETAVAKIGGYVNGSLKWSGRLAEFRIWNQPRTDEEILNNQGCPLTGRESGLVSYWSMVRVDSDGTTPDLAGDRPGQVQGATIVPDDALTSVMPLPEVPNRDETAQIKSDEVQQPKLPAIQPPSQTLGKISMAKEKKIAPVPTIPASNDVVADEPKPPTEPQPAAVPEYQSVEPLSPDHIMGWKSTTTGLEDYAMWRQTLKDEKLEGDPPFRRGRIWA